MDDPHIDSLLAQLTSEEKISLLAGVDFWHTKAVPRLNIPSIRLSDGPNGVRGTRFFNSTPAACLPCGTALGATWDIDLIEIGAEMVGDECKAKGAHVWLGPTVNIQRSPLGGRGFESFSEDPTLSGYLAAAMIRGVQRKGIASAIKHFVTNDMEDERKAVNNIVSDRALREIYLLPFQIAMRDAQPWCIMTAYNRLNGVHVSEKRDLLQGVLREEWRWDGALISDWYGTYSTAEAANAGLDLEMPGPTMWRAKLLSNAVGARKVSLQTIDKRARAVLELVGKVKQSGVKENAQEGTINTKEQAKLLRKLSADSIVLLQNNDGLLPLSQGRTTALIGPNVFTARYCGGGSAALRPYHAVSPLEGIREICPDVTYAVGCEAYNDLPSMGKELRTAEGKPGFKLFIFSEPPAVTDRKAIDELYLDDTFLFMADYKHPAVKNDLLYAVLEAEYTPEESGRYAFGLTVRGTARFFIDGDMVIDNATKQTVGTSFFGSGTIEERQSVSLHRGRTVSLRVEFGSAPTATYSKPGVTSFGVGGFRLGCARLLDVEAEIKKAAELATTVDQVVVFAGLNKDWESEGFDRPHMDLPGHQDRLIEAVALANPRTVVVLQSGTPVTTPWASSVGAIVQAWYGGNETGSAIADVLYGHVNPSGKLPVSWPRCNEDNPAFLNYRSDGGRCIYGEDVYVGYRFYEKVRREVQWPFGHGLSYTSFQMDSLEVNVDGETLTVTFSIANVGTRPGAEVPQIYVSPENPSGVGRPLKELKGFRKVYLEPGEQRSVTVDIPIKYATSYWHEEQGCWFSQKDVYRVSVGPSSSVAALVGAFTTSRTMTWTGI